jgi:hypothetical protein
MGCNSCNGTTGLVTNGAGGYLNAMGGGMPATTTYMIQNGNQFIGEGASGAYGGVGNPPMLTPPPSPLQMPSAFTPVSVSDINSASNSFTDGGGNPVFANPNLPAVTEDECNAIKCGAPGASTDPMAVYACSQSYGAGVWDLCTDARCAPYRGSACHAAMPVVSAPVPSTGITAPLATQFPNQPLTPNSLTTPLPDVTGGQAWGVAPAPVGPSVECMAAQRINANPLVACAALGALFFLIKGLK